MTNYMYLPNGSVVGSVANATAAYNPVPGVSITTMPATINIPDYNELVSLFTPSSSFLERPGMPDILRREPVPVRRPEKKGVTEEDLTREFLDNLR